MEHGLSIRVLCLCMAPLVALGAAQPKPVPDQVAEIAQRNWESLSRLRTCSAVVEETVTHGPGDSEAPFVVGTYTIWVKGRNLRQDYAVKPEFRNQPLEVDQDGSHKIVLQKATRWAQTPEISVSYSLGADHATIGPGTANPHFGVRASILHKYMMTISFNQTLRQAAEALAKRGNTPSVSQVDMDGIPAYLIAWTFQGGKGVRKVWVVPSKGYLVQKVQAVREGKLLREFVASLKQYQENVFWFERAEQKHLDYDGTLISRRVAVVKKLALDIAVDDGLFTLDGIGVPPGVEIRDNTLKVRAHRDKPFELPEDFVRSVVGDERPKSAAQRAAQLPDAGNAPTQTEAAPREPAEEASRNGSPPAPRGTWKAVVTVLGVAMLCAAVGFLLVNRSKNATDRDGGETR